MLILEVYNIIRQLSTLSRHAEEMFGNLFQEAEGMVCSDLFCACKIFNIVFLFQAWPPGAPASRLGLTSSP